MDLVAACRAFVAVAEYGSFTTGAAAARIPQPVASRRVAALEEHFGARLLERTSRSVTLTTFGRDMLPSARRLVELAETMEHDAVQAQRRPFRLAVPAVCASPRLVRLVVEGRRSGLHLDPHPAGPGERAELSRTLEARAAIVAVTPDSGAWRVPLGLASTADPQVPAIYLETLRAGRADNHQQRRRVWIQPEDDVPHVRDRVTRLRDALGLQPAQVTVATSLVAAAASVIDSSDLLLCAEDQADELGLHWRPIGEVKLVRGYDISATLGEDRRQLRTQLHAAIGRCLGAVNDDGGQA
ncbi:DNA-binding transcriptional LysR family regulator [Micromonospora pisi]|uniref:DNA-binding transcriptional LysR family regulator n=1 Tax=Micromonospora pisi TaxID=589240 RepID=A0A495JRQ8_9ACTN|nr:LysR family transcriptional regulator [Micromonospora pisi]RKR91531.1 DNA-binding transcriptional LysR family regulator [Micromonospora pisi]